MFEKICIIGCGLIGSSILRDVYNSKISKSVTVFDNSREDMPNLINPGDTVIFKEISKEKYLNYEQ